MDNSTNTIFHFRDSSVKKSSNCEVLRDVSRGCVIVRFTNFNLGSIFKVRKKDVENVYVSQPRRNGSVLVEEQKKACIG